MGHKMSIEIEKYRVDVNISLKQASDKSYNLANILPYGEERNKLFDVCDQLDNIQDRLLRYYKKDNLIKTLNSFGGLLQNWNGYGDIQTSSLAIGATIEFINNIPSNLKYPDVSPYQDGSIKLIWVSNSIDLIEVFIETYNKVVIHIVGNRMNPHIQGELTMSCSVDNILSMMSPFTHLLEDN